jgi:hypothetical protein
LPPLIVTTRSAAQTAIYSACLISFADRIAISITQCGMQSTPSAVIAFRTPRAIAKFGDRGCVSGDVGALGLDRVERANAGTILAAEQALGCPE